MSIATYPLLRVFTPYSSLMHYKGYFVGACPVCNGTPTKMVVRPEQGAWHCYSCGAGGDPIDFLQAVEQLSRDQAYLLYKMLIRDDLSATPPAMSMRPAAEVVPSAPAEVPPARNDALPLEASPELPEREQAALETAAPAVEAGTLGDLRQRLAAVDGFRGVAYFGPSGKALLLEGMKAEALTAINAYFDAAFRATHRVLGAPGDPSLEGVLQDEQSKFMRIDAPVAGSRCRVFLSLAAGASEARFRMVVRSFLSSAKIPPQ